MSWVGVIGTRQTNPDMRRDIEARVRQQVEGGASIVSGGGTGVDTIASLAALDAVGDDMDRIRVYLPIELGKYAATLLVRAEQGKCLPEDARETIAHLNDLAARNPASVVWDDSYDTLNEDAFYQRNQQILNLADELLAFRLQGNPTASKLIAGTDYTIDLARSAGTPVTVHDYTM